MWNPIRLLAQKLGNRVRSRKDALTALCLLTDPQDRMVVIDLGLIEQWDLHFASTLEDAERIMQEARPQIVLMDRDFAGGRWRAAVSALAAGSQGPCIILASKVADEYLWNEVVACGGYEVLPKPLRRDELARTMRLARSYRSSARRAPYQIK